MATGMGFVADGSILDFSLVTARALGSVMVRLFSSLSGGTVDDLPNELGVLFEMLAPAVTGKVWFEAEKLLHLNVGTGARFDRVTWRLLNLMSFGLLAVSCRSLPSVVFGTLSTGISDDTSYAVVDTLEPTSVILTFWGHFD